MSSHSQPGHAAGSQLAQLLAEVLRLHAPAGAAIDTATKGEAINGWLEGMEAHTAKFIGPVLQMVLDQTDPPPAIRALIEEAISPTAQFSSSIVQIFLWGIVNSLVSTGVSPFLQEVANLASTAAVAAGIKRPVDPATIATAVGRGLTYGGTPPVTPSIDFYAQAAENGLGQEELDLMVSVVGLPPALQELFEMQRRGIITADQVAEGLQQGDFRDDWIPYAVQLAHGWLTPGDFVRAAVEAQMDYDDAQDWAQKTGLDTTTALPLDTGGSAATPDMFGLAYSIAGRPPGPQELARMALRGIIPQNGTGAGATTFQQGIAESDVKTKWTDPLWQLAQYVPPPREVGTLLEHGAITETQAQQFWTDGGVPADLAAGFVTMTLQEHIGQEKLLAKGDILTGYFDQIFSNAEATELLGLIGYTGTVAADVLAIVDFRREIQAINSVVRKIGTLYQAFKLSSADASTALTSVGVPGDQAAALLNTWNALRVAPVRVPSASDISKAYEYKTITQDEALEALAELGYQARDAAIVLSANAEAAVTPLPGPGSTTTG